MMEIQQIETQLFPSTNHKDIFFIETLIDTISSEYNIDLNRICKLVGILLEVCFLMNYACQLNNKITASSFLLTVRILWGVFARDIIHPTGCTNINGTSLMEFTHTMTKMDGIFRYLPDSFWAYSNNTDVIPITTQLPDLNTSDGSTVERYSAQNGDGCVC